MRLPLDMLWGTGDECESKETGWSFVYGGRGRKGSTVNHMRRMGRAVTPSKDEPHKTAREGQAGRSLGRCLAGGLVA